MFADTWPIIVPVILGKIEEFLYTMICCGVVNWKPYLPQVDRWRTNLFSFFIWNIRRKSL